MLKYLSLKYLLISKQIGIIAYAVQKIDFGGSILGGFLGGGHPQTMSKYLSLEYLLISKKLSPSLSRSKNWFSVGPFGEISGRWYPQTMSKYLFNIY